MLGPLRATLNHSVWQFPERATWSSRSLREVNGNVPCLVQTWGATGDCGAHLMSLGWKQQTPGFQTLQGAETRISQQDTPVFLVVD